MKLTAVTPLILTYNEAPNIEACLLKLKWAERVIVLDSFSTDETKAIVGRFANAHVHQRTFDNHTNQWNYGLDIVESEWVLTLDADYLCGQDFIDELADLVPTCDVYFASFRYCVFGKPLTASLYPPRAVLFRASQFRYVDDGHTQLLDVGSSQAGMLESPILHDDRKSLDRWCSSQIKYARLEADKLLAAPRKELGWKDRIRKRIFLAPLLTLVYCLFIKKLLFDGRAGVYYALQRVFAELLLSLTLLDERFRTKQKMK